MSDRASEHRVKIGPQTGQQYAKIAQSTPLKRQFLGSICCEWRYDSGIFIFPLSSPFRTLLLSLGFLTEKLKIKPPQLGQPGQKQAS
jgi:hypothetical protein